MRLIAGYTKTMKHWQRIAGLFDIGEAKRTERPANPVDPAPLRRGNPWCLRERVCDGVFVGVGQMAEIEACRVPHLAMIQRHNFKTATPEVSDQAAGFGNVQRQPARDIMRLLLLAQHLDRMTQHRLGRRGEGLAIVGPPDRRRGNGMDGGDPHCSHDFRKARNCRQRHLDPVGLEHVVRPEPLAKPAVGPFIEQGKRIATTAGIDHQPDRVRADINDRNRGVTTSSADIGDGRAVGAPLHG